MENISKNVSRRIKRIEIEEEEKWLEEANIIPFIQFPSDWMIQVIPPFGDAVIRFRVKLPTGTEKSIYLDKRASLGAMYDKDYNPVAYWEVYPYQGDVGRCYLNEIDELLSMIEDESERKDD